jgi:hypothetical protein
VGTLPLRFCFQTKNPTLGNFFFGGGGCNGKSWYNHLVYFTAFGNTLWPFGTYISPHLGILYQEKFGNPAKFSTLQSNRGLRNLLVKLARKTS